MLDLVMHMIIVMVSWQQPGPTAQQLIDRLPRLANQHAQAMPFSATLDLVDDKGAAMVRIETYTDEESTSFRVTDMHDLTPLLLQSGDTIYVYDLVFGRVVRIKEPVGRYVFAGVPDDELRSVRTVFTVLFEANKVGPTVLDIQSIFTQEGEPVLVGGSQFEWRLERSSEGKTISAVFTRGGDFQYLFWRGPEYSFMVHGIRTGDQAIKVTEVEIDEVELLESIYVVNHADLFDRETTSRVQRDDALMDLFYDAIVLRLGMYHPSLRSEELFPEGEASLEHLRQKDVDASTAWRAVLGIETPTTQPN